MAIAVPLGTPGGASAAPAVTMNDAHEVRTTWTSDFGIDRPAGLVYDPVRDELLVAEDDGQTTTVRRVDFDEQPKGSFTLSGVGDADSLAFDATTNELETATAAASGLDDPDGATVDATTGTTFLLDSRDRSIIEVQQRGQQSRVPLQGVGPGEIRGLAHNPADGLVYVTVPQQRLLYGVDTKGTVQKQYDLESIAIGSLSAMTFAPSADRTDDSTVQNLYIADAGTTETFGGITEVSLAAEPVVAAAVTTEIASLVQVIHTSQFTPPSPDPSGIAWLPGTDRLQVVDSEVDEVTGAGYHGVNMWQLTRSGGVTNTGTLHPTYSSEPTGVTHDPGTNTLFVSDDNKARINVVKAGPDNRFGTSDDVVTFINTGALGIADTEDPAFDTVTGHLYVSDGISAEVYDIDPVNGVFGDGNDMTTHFDVGVHGVRDGEGLAFDHVRNTLLVGDRTSRRIYEITKANELLRIIDARVSGLTVLSGLAVAPAIDNPARRDYWIVDRAVDNGPDPDENDGKIFEVSAPAGPISNSAPEVSAGPDLTVVLPDGATLQGSVFDDGLPDPPGATAIQWSKVSGPGTVTFANSNAASTTATFSTDGTYVLRLTASDSAFQSSDDVAVTVLPQGSVEPTVIQRAVATQSDDAEEDVTTGGMSLGSSDLELVETASTRQVVGVRFTGVAIPTGASILSASVQFTVDEASTGTASLTIKGQAADNPGTFTTTAGNVSSRATTTASVPWTPPEWNTIGAAGADQRTADLRGIVQEIVNRPGWASGNAVVLIVTGTGSRIAESFDGTAAPVLHLEYTTDSVPPPNSAPVVDSVVINQTAPRTNDAVTATVAAHDDDGDALAHTYQWIKNGSDLAGQTAASLDLSAAGNGDKGDQVSVRVTATDGLASSAPVTSAAVTVVNSDPVFNQNLADRTSSEGDAVSFSAVATDVDGDALTYAATGLPAGVAVDPVTGLVSGTVAAGAAASSPYSAGITVGDGPTVDATDTFTWTVAGPDVAPATPAGLRASVSSIDVTLDWNDNTEPDLAGYRVYRSSSETGPFTPLNATLLTLSTFTDATAPAGVTSHYRVTAVDTGNKESLPATTDATRAIAFRSTASAAARGATSVSVAAPPGRVSGDAMIASLLLDRTATVTAPAGWAVIRTDDQASGLRQVLLVKVAGAAEPASYTFGLSTRANAAAAIVAYIGVDPLNPVETSSGAGNASSTSITAPAVTTSGPNRMLVGFFGIATEPSTTIAPPNGMLEQTEIAQNSGKPKLTLSAADEVLAAAGGTGPRNAASGKPGASIGQLIALRPPG